MSAEIELRTLEGSKFQTVGAAMLKQRSEGRLLIKKIYNYQQEIWANAHKMHESL